MNPPNVYEVTIPNSQRIISIRKIVQSIDHLQNSEETTECTGLAKTRRLASFAR